MLVTKTAISEQSDPPPDPPLDDPSLDRLLRLAGARLGYSISVAGPASLEVMVALCRAGYARVECARQATCAGADETSDLLILTGPADSLGGLAARTLPLLRNGGVVAACLEQMDDDPPIRGALLVRGMEVITSTLDPGAPNPGDPNPGVLGAAGGLIVAHRVRRQGRLALVS